MGITTAEDCRRLELEDLRRLSERDFDRRKSSEGFDGRRISSNTLSDTDEDGDELVCVTSGVSLLGLAVVNQLLVRGFSVRILIENSEDTEKVREMETEAGLGANRKLSTVTANLTEYGSLLDAFEGCRGVIHTSAFIDPSGLTGYSKSMVEVEKKVSENVVEACAAASSVKYCVFTSSLLACIWRDARRGELSQVVNHESWSDQSLCIDKKLWYALGKLRAEKAAWRIANERDLKLTTICPGLLTAPNLCIINPTPTFAYLKGAEELYEQGLLATVSVARLAEAQVAIFESMAENNAHGRYICFDQIIKTQNEAEILATQIGLPATKFSPSPSTAHSSVRFQLSNERLSNLTSQMPTRCYFETDK